MARKPGDVRQKFQGNWFDGIWLGRSSGSDEHYLERVDGVKRARTIKRHDPCSRRNAALLKDVKGLPWDPVSTSMSGSSENAGPITIIPPRLVHIASCQGALARIRCMQHVKVGEPIKISDHSTQCMVENKVVQHVHSEHTHEVIASNAENVKRTSRTGCRGNTA